MLNDVLEFAKFLKRATSLWRVVSEATRTEVRFDFSNGLGVRAWQVGENEKFSANIVYFPEFGRHPISCWGDGEQPFLIEHLESYIKDSTGQSVRSVLVEYPMRSSTMACDETDIKNTAASVASALTALGTNEHPTIIVAHGFGGILAREMLLSADEQCQKAASSVRGILFLSVPHKGGGYMEFLAALDKHILGGGLRKTA